MLTCAEGSTDELKVYVHTPAFARPQCQTSSPKPLDQSNPNLVWNLHGHGAIEGGGGGGETMFAASRSHDRQGGRKAARPYMVKPFKNHLGNQWTVFNRTDDSGYHCLFKLLPWVDLDLFYDKVKHVAEISYLPIC